MCKVKGKLFVIDSGSDGSGKQTQTTLLAERLTKEGYNVRKLDFPAYQSDSSALVRMYLSGAFGENPEDVNAYASSTFFAVDRIANYLEYWKEFYENGGIILSDRYTTSNMIHQASKIDCPIERQRYLDWLDDLEFEKMGLPRPTQVFLLQVPVAVTMKLIENRLNKFSGEERKDIHESNIAYLEKCYALSTELVTQYNWSPIQCATGEEMRTIENIHEEIYAKIKPLL